MRIEEARIALGEEGSEHAAPERDRHLGEQAGDDQPAPPADRHARRAQHGEHDGRHLQGQQPVRPADPERIAVEADAVAERHQDRDEDRRPGARFAPAPQVECRRVEGQAAGDAGHRQCRQDLVGDAVRLDQSRQQQQRPRRALDDDAGLGPPRRLADLPHHRRQRHRHADHADGHGEEQGGDVELHAETVARRADCRAATASIRGAGPPGRGPAQPLRKASRNRRRPQRSIRNSRPPSSDHLSA